METMEDKLGPWEEVSDGRLTFLMPPTLPMDADAFFDFCQINSDLRIERTAEGEIIITTPAGFETGFRNIDLSAQVRNWAKADGTGVAGDSSTGYTLPNGAERSPDVSWIRRERLAGLTAEQKRKFLPRCPDFAIELMSLHDRLPTVQAKMEEYIANGLRLGWLIEPVRRRVHVYCPDSTPLVLENPGTISAEPELPGFALDLTEIWEPNL